MREGHARAMERVLLQRLSREIAERTPYSPTTVFRTLEELAEADFEDEDPLVFFNRCSAAGLSPVGVAGWARMQADLRRRREAQRREQEKRETWARRSALAWHGLWVVVALLCWLAVVDDADVRDNRAWGLAILWAWVGWHHARKALRIRRGM